MVSEGESQDSEDVFGDEDDKNVDGGDEDGVDVTIVTMPKIK